jgi:thioredoxin 2
MRDELPLLVDVWAPWCGPCRAMAPMFAQAAHLLEPELRLLKLNSDEAQTLSVKLGIRSIPTLLLIWRGQILARHAGVMDTHRIVNWAREHLKDVQTATTD